MTQPFLKLSGTYDTLFSRPGYPLPFEFNAEVAHVFDDMITRSIPFYAEVIALMGRWLASHPPRAQQRIYDIGCSTGTSLCALGALLTEPCHLVGIDTSPAMLERAREKLASLAERHTVELLCQSASHSSFTSAHMVLLNYTLQFIPLTERLHILKTIYQGLGRGGMLFISEKLVSPHQAIQDTVTQHYEGFKQAAGYSLSEIERKKSALERVLVPLRMSEHLAMLEAAGFQTVEIIFKWQNFATFLALKD